MLERLPIEAETALALEEAEHLLRQLTLLTERGRITWRCVHYNPLELMPFLTEGKPETAYITHSVMATGEYNGRSYLTEIGENLTIPGSEGNVSVELTVFYSGQRVASYVWHHYSEEAQMGFAAVVLTRLADSEAVAQGFQKARYNTDFTPDYIVAHPLTALGRTLCRERRFMDYHRIVTDPTYREKLLSEPEGTAAK